MKHIKIGREITEVINRLGLSKSEFGRRVGVQKQNVNRLLECHYMATNKLEDICEALDYNFFRLWVDDEPTTIKAESSAVSVGSGTATLYNNTQAGAVGETATELERLRSENEMLKRTVADKQMIIDLLINKKQLT